MKSAVRWLASATVAGSLAVAGIAAETPPRAGEAPTRPATVSFPGYRVSQRLYRPAIMHDPQAMVRLPDEKGPDEEGARTALGLLRGRSDSPLSPAAGPGYAVLPSRAADKAARNRTGRLEELLADRGDADAPSDSVSKEEIESVLGGARRGATPGPDWAPAAERAAPDGSGSARDHADDASDAMVFSGIPSDRGASVHALLLLDGRDARGDAHELGRGFRRALELRSRERLGWSDSRRQEYESGISAGGGARTGGDGSNPYAALLTPPGGAATDETRPSLYTPRAEPRGRGDVDAYTPRPAGGDARDLGQTPDRESLMEPGGMRGPFDDASAQPAPRDDGARSLRELFREK